MACTPANTPTDQMYELISLHLPLYGLPAAVKITTHTALIIGACNHVANSLFPLQTTEQESHNYLRPVLTHSRLTISYLPTTTNSHNEEKPIACSAMRLQMHEARNTFHRADNKSAISLYHATAVPVVGITIGYHDNNMFAYKSRGLYLNTDQNIMDCMLLSMSLQQLTNDAGCKLTGTYFKPTASPLATSHNNEGAIAMTELISMDIKIHAPQT